MKKMKIKVITKSEIIKYIAIFLAFVLLITTVVFGVRNDNKAQKIEELNSLIAEKESLISEKVSEKDSLEEEKNNLDQLYKNAIEKNDAQEKAIEKLNKQIEKLKKRLESNDKDKETTTKKPTNKPTNKLVAPDPVPSKGKTVYLTFDDGPSQYTDDVLDVLDKYNVKATFFVVNGRYNSLMKEIVDRGHQIGLHSYTHDYSDIYTSEKAYFNDLKKISNVVKDQTGVETKIIRFPGGGSNTISKKHAKGIMTTLTKSVVKKGYTYFDWNCSNGDADGASTTVEQLINCSKFPRSQKNIIVLMHDTKKSTLEALPKIIEYYQKCEMTFGVLDSSVEFKNHNVLN